MMNTARLCWLIAAVANCRMMDYTGYALYRFRVDPSADTLRHLEAFDTEFDEATKTSRLQLDVWSEPSKSNPFADVLVAPEFTAKFRRMVISEERRLIAKLRRRRKRSIDAWDHFDTHMYHSYGDMTRFMRSLARQKSDMVTIHHVATSYEHRQIYGVKISKPGATRIDKPSFIIDAGVHAREWIAPAVAIYMIKYAVANYGVDERLTRSLNKFDWYIIPQINPDGYEYSRNTDRLWRKTRSVNTTVNKWCMGADANRNWGYRWGEAGANRTPCSNIYMGSHPYSEPEIRGLKDFIAWNVTNPILYVSLHSYGQLLLSPWGYTNEKTANYLDQRKAAQLAVQSMRNTTGASYNFGTISELMYPASGTSIDYMQHLGVPYIYGVELRPTDAPNSPAFNLPPEYIETTGKEMLAAVYAISEHAVKVQRL
ncbi:unnamed protein product [Caenorhabditis bovis]|uniref:Peptidase M14 domain-containing protein n=1 Tax=Caenorhabditis bovis TaxID=2654633 RepID=A0A8S1ENC4_9PELO|nr:unnamed protein product [Caenorhabditis bovis]